MSLSIQNGCTVTLHYTLTVEGKVIDSSRGGAPFSFIKGSGEVIPGLDSQLAALEIGAKKIITVPPADGYGDRNPTALAKVPKESFGDVSKLNVGDAVRGQQGEDVFQATVQEIGDTYVVLDLNHPLAGKTLEFDVEVLKVEPAGAAN